MKKIVPVILSGGFGKRLTPVLTEDNPKQFNDVIHKPCLFTKAAENCTAGGFLPPIIVGNITHKSLIQKNVSQYDCIILEPEPKNTAPAILLAALYSAKNYGEDATILALPSDHLISSRQGFLESIKAAQERLNKSEGVVLFGVRPTYPSEKYGYIKTMKGEAGLIMKAFTEKPSQRMAERFIEEGNYYWNSGIFLLNAKMYIERCVKYIPKLYKIVLRAFEEANYNNGVITVSEAFKDVEDISIDYAIMEKMGNLPMVELKSPWADLGSFESIYALKSKTKGDVTQRPWGTYEVLEIGKGYKMKKIIVEAGKSLSMQSHGMRAEHWTVIQGKASVIKDGKESFLGSGQSVFIEPNIKHRLANATNELLEVFEIQLGEYLEEDDIVRYVDAMPPI